MREYVVAKYIRLSLEDEKTDSLSIFNQRMLLDRHIDSLELDETETLEFIDNGHSGTNFERPAVQELLELVRAGRVNCILVKDFSRFGRNALETGYFIERVFPLFGTRFISVSDGFDSAEHEGDTGGLEVSFKFLMHEYYSKDLSRKEKSAKYIKFQRGEYQSVICPYGYRKGADGRMEIDEEPAAVVRLIFEEALSMKSAQDIVNALYEKQIPTPGEYKKQNGKGFHDVSRCCGIWQRTTVLRILTDERYTGTYIMGKRAVTEIGGHRIRMKDESEWFKIPGHHPAIVSRELYDEAQTKLRHFKCPKTDRAYTLRGKVYCGGCHHAMNRALRKIPAFICRYTAVDENAVCHRLEIDEHDLEEMIFASISERARAILNTEPGSDAARSDAMKTAQSGILLAECQNEKRELYERFVLGGLSAEEYTSGKAVLDAEISRLNRIVGSVASAAVNAAGLYEAAKMAAAADALTPELTELLIEKVYVYPESRIEIVWKMPSFGAEMPTTGAIVESENVAV
jgi:DNA invertase Pin-like site-specific DNA recombinase